MLAAHVHRIPDILDVVPRERNKEFPQVWQLVAGSDSNDSANQEGLSVSSELQMRPELHVRVPAPHTSTELSFDLHRACLHINSICRSRDDEALESHAAARLNSTTHRNLIGLENPSVLMGGFETIGYTFLRIR